MMLGKLATCNIDALAVAICDICCLSYTAATVSFNQSVYTVNENEGPAQITLVLSNPSSSNITVQVSSVSESATGEYTTDHYWCINSYYIIII